MSRRIDLMEKLLGRDLEAEEVGLVGHEFESRLISTFQLQLFTPRQECVLEKYYIDLWNLDSIGERINVTKERARQIVALATNKLRNNKYAREIMIRGEEVVYDLKKREELKAEIRELEDMKTDLQVMVNHLIDKKHLIEDFEKENTDCEYWEDIPLEELDLSTRVYNSLARYCDNNDFPRSTAVFKAMRLEELNCIRSLGKKSAKELIEKLKERGITLAND